MKKFSIDVAICNGCRDCQIVCKDEHCSQDWRPYAAAQPETGQFWMFVDELVRGQVPVVKMTYTPTLCAHCDDAPCAEACPNGAFNRREDGLLLIDPDVCCGCGACKDACPLGAIFMNEELGIAQKCTGCAHLLDNGWDVPRCVDVCPHEAIKWVDEDDEVLEGGEPLAPVANLGARVLYHHIPKQFIAGCLVDFEADEVAIGAKVAVDGEGAHHECETDEFGDFIFEGLEPGVYEVTMQAEGFDAFKRTVDVTEKCVTMGDLSVRG